MKILILRSNPELPWLISGQPGVALVKVVGPIVDEVADEMGDEANICKLNVDQNQKTAKKYGIQSIPTLLIFKDGNPVQKLVGVKPKHAMIKSIKSYL